jgi:hypothetical protein
LLRLRVARGCKPTGELLMGQLLAARGGRNHPERVGVVNWGLPYDGPDKALNANAGRLDKFQQAEKLAAFGGPVPQAHRSSEPSDYPMLGRCRSHSGGTDIRIAFGPEDTQNCWDAGSQFFVPYIRSTKEYRVWIYRRRHLGTYEKWLAHPRKFKGIGRNYDNGWAFRLVPSVIIPREAVDLSARAVTALALDFGAVDVIQGIDGSFHVLEVNTAPGVEGGERQVIKALADRIAKWHALEFPERRSSV